ncbi:murein biosynthesis integral membrane protein MurJ [Asticcacaulis sp. SL142]|uniref:murein biosynthesis integral membrane protein MurJ n=1 Tax=Asticcacaulis sp. SL142 TaxID=2995155 RepID=UPI00226D1409|nr:murein biosynthesis integral membrane protein MurJ [Asticcacaulis sp. SL142]WAC47358.1 murein biosynthesis integral membrane protein MurJ [Asticcacaulis sp. SL142]
MSQTELPAESKAPKSTGLVKSSMIYSGFTLISRFMGLARDLVVTAALGASGTIMADAYATAISFPNLFRRIFAEGAFTAAFVPAYSQVLEKDGKDAADKLARDALATLSAFTIVLTVIIQLAMPWLMTVYSSGYLDNPEKFNWAVLLTQITMPYLPCMVIVALLSGVLNARGRFIVSAVAPTVMNLFMLLAVLPFRNNPQDAAVALCWAAAASGVAQAGLLVWGCRKTGAKIGLARPTLSPEIKGLIVLAVPGALAAAATQINIFVSQWFSGNVDGARTWMSVADRLYQLPLGLVGVAIGVALLPTLSKAVQAQDHDRAQTAMDEAMVFSMALTLPAAAALLFMPFFLIDGLFSRGLFTAHDAMETGKLLFHYGWGVPAFVLTRVLTPAFFARRDTKGPMKFALVSVALNVALCVALYPIMGVPGLVVATSASAWSNVILMVFTLMRRNTWSPSLKAQASLLKIIIAGLGMGAFCAAASYFRTAIESPLPDAASKEIAILGVCFAGILVYGGLLILTGAVRPADLKRIMKRQK